MPMTERFYSVNGQMMGYESGGVKKDFLTDHLGSITAEMDQSQTRTYDTRYSAYGRNNWSTGTGCGFGWVGSYGYRETGLFHMSHYVRARHYSYVTGGWSTVDPLWPEENPFGYVGGRVLRSIDPLGLQGKPDRPKPWPKKGGCKTFNCHSKGKEYIGPIGIALGHACIVVQGPNHGCSGNQYIESGATPCASDAPDNPKEWDCTLISTDCFFAGEVCNCVNKSIDRERNRGQLERFFDFFYTGFCWGYTRGILECARANTPDPLDQFKSCRDKEIDRIFHECEKPTGPIMWWLNPPPKPR